MSVLAITGGNQLGQKGQPIEVRSAEYSGTTVFHSVHLAPQPPQVPPLRIENLTAWHMPDEPGELPNRVMVATPRTAARLSRR